MLRLSGAASAVSYAAGVIPIALNAVIHMIRKADLLQSERNSIPYDFFHRVLGIVAVAGVNMIIRKHSIYLLQSCSCVTIISASSASR